MSETAMKTPPIVGTGEWEDARQNLLVKEKELTRARCAGGGATNMPQTHLANEAQRGDYLLREWDSSRQLDSFTSTSNFFAACLIRRHASSRSSSVTSFT